ncbi:hypothetical protein IWX49DRAFT_76962 [Phyllosticta citricarpa]
MFFAQHSPSGPSNYMHARRLCRGSPLPRFLAQHLDYTPVRRLSLRKERSVSRSAACSQECQEQYGLRRLQLPFLSFIFISFFLCFFFSFFFFFFFFFSFTHPPTHPCPLPPKEREGKGISQTLDARALPIYIPTVHMHGNGLRRAQPTSTPVRLRAKWPTTTECLVILEGEGRVRNCRLADCLLACLPACPAPRALFRSRRMRACIERKKATS